MSTSVGEVLKEKQLTVNSYKNINNTVNSKTVIADNEETIGEYLNRSSHEPEAIAKILAEKLEDKKSERYYLLLAKNIEPPEILLEVLSYVLEKDAQGGITRTKPIYFIGILKRKGYKTRFRGD